MSRIEVSTAAYEAAHGKKPRGVGNWAFCPRQNYNAANYLYFVQWFSNMTYSDARRAAVKHFNAQIGTNVIVVCS